MDVYPNVHLCARCLRKPEKGIESPGTGAAMGIESGSFLRGAHALNCYILVPMMPIKWAQFQADKGYKKRYNPYKDNIF